MEQQITDEKSVTLATTDEMKKLRFVAANPEGRSWCLDIIVRYSGKAPVELREAWQELRSNLDVDLGISGSWVYKESIED